MSFPHLIHVGKLVYVCVHMHMHSHSLPPLPLGTYHFPGIGLGARMCVVSSEVLGSHAYFHQLFPVTCFSPWGQLIFYYPVVSEMQNLFFLNLCSKQLNDKVTALLAQRCLPPLMFFHPSLIPLPCSLPPEVLILQTSGH